MVFGYPPRKKENRTPVGDYLPAHLEPGALEAAYEPKGVAASTVAPVAADVATRAKTSSLVRPSAAFRTSNPNRIMLTTFQTGHGFSQAVTSSYNYNDTTDYVLGSQSAYIVTNGAGGQAILTKSNAVTLDMTGKVFAVLLKVTNLANLNRITMLAGSGGFANNYQIQLQASNTLTDQEITPEGRWIWVTLPWNPSAVSGTPARNAITDLRIAVVDNNTGQQVKVQVQAIATQAERVAYPNGVVSIGFDDNWVSQSTLAIPYLDKYGYQPTVYSIVDMIGTAGRQTLTQLKRIEEYSGGEVAAHSWTNATHTAGFTGVSAATLDNELQLMKQWLIDNGFQGRELLAYPMGNFNASVMDIAAKYYKFARTVNIRQQETQPPGNPYTCRAQSSTNTVTLAQITAQIDAAYANGTWLNLLYHDITTGTASGSVQVTQANFQGAIDYIAQKGIPVRTVSQVLKATAP